MGGGAAGLQARAGTRPNLTPLSQFWTLRPVSLQPEGLILEGPHPTPHQQVDSTPPLTLPPWARVAPPHPWEVTSLRALEAGRP